MLTLRAYLWIPRRAHCPPSPHAPIHKGTLHRGGEGGRGEGGEASPLSPLWRVGSRRPPPFMDGCVEAGGAVGAARYP